MNLCGPQGDIGGRVFPESGIKSRTDTYPLRLKSRSVFCNNQARVQCAKGNPGAKTLPCALQFRFNCYFPQHLSTGNTLKVVCAYELLKMSHWHQPILPPNFPHFYLFIWNVYECMENGPMKILWKRHEGDSGPVYTYSRIGWWVWLSDGRWELPFLNAALHNKFPSCRKLAQQGIS